MQLRNTRALYKAWLCMYNEDKRSEKLLWYRKSRLEKCEQHSWRSGRLQCKHAIGVNGKKTASWEDTVEIDTRLGLISLGKAKNNG